MRRSNVHRETELAFSALTLAFGRGLPRSCRPARAADGTFRCSIALNVPLECPTLRRLVEVVQRSSVEAASNSPARRSGRRKPHGYDESGGHGHNHAGAHLRPCSRHARKLQERLGDSQPLAPNAATSPPVFLASARCF
jgi:hypothetical protein